MNSRLENIPIIDSHLHLWDVERLDYPWLRDVSAIHKSFFIEDYKADTAGFNVNKMVFVQCECLPEQNLEEIRFVEQQALKDPRICGIVAYAALENGSAIRNVLSVYQQNPLIKGVRRMYDDTRELCSNLDFLNAVRMLPEFGLSMDLSIKPALVLQTLEMISICPDTQFILDHLGKPDIKNDMFEQFKKDIDAFSAFPNVVAKISGLITEADWNNWSQQEIQKYITYAIGSFGPDRLMFGGDWPVVLLSGRYNQWLQALFRSLEQHSDETLQKLFYDTASKVYRI